MKRECVVWLISLVSVMASGCVMKSTYDEAVGDLEATRTELESAKAQQEVLAQQVTTLENLTKETTRDAEATAARVQQAKDDAEAERKMAEERLARLKRMVTQLTATQGALLDALEAAKEDGVALKSTVEMYKTKLAAGGELRTPSFPPPMARVDEPAERAIGPSVQAPVPTDSSLQPAVTTPAAPTDATAAKPQPVKKQASERADDGWFSAIKGWVISLWHSVFS